MGAGDEDFTPISGYNAEDIGSATVGLVRADKDVDNRDRVHLNVDLLEDFADQCRQMGWDQITVSIEKDDLVLAHERDSDPGGEGGIYAAMAPCVEGLGEDEDE